MVGPNGEIPDNLAEFWDFYLGEHSKVKTRNLHIFGTTIGLTLVVTGLLQRHLLLALLGIIIAYGIAWYAHFNIEGNRPATFKRPWLSFICDFKMLYCFLTGKLDSEVKRVLGSSQS